MAEVKRPTEAVEEKPAPRTSDAFTASGVIGVHGIEHMYGRAFNVTIPYIRDDLGLSYLQSYLMDGIRSIASGLTSMGSGFFSDLFQDRRVQMMTISMALVGSGYLLVAVSPIYALIVIFLILPSVGAALWHPPALAMLSQRFPRSRGFLTSLHRSTGNLGDTIAPLIAGSLLIEALDIDWRWVLGAGAPMVFVLALLIPMLLRSWGRGPRLQEASFGRNTKAQFHSLMQAFKGGGLWAIAPIFAVSAVHGMGDRALLTMIPIYIHEVLEEESAFFGGFFGVGFHLALLSAGVIAVGPVLGAYSDRIGRKPLIILAMFVAAVSSLGMALSGVSIGFTIAVAVFGCFAFSVNSLTQAAAMDIAHGRQLEGTFVGLMWGFNAFFGFATALSAGALADAAGPEAVFYLASAIFTVGFLMSLFMSSTGSRRPLKARD